MLTVTSWYYALFIVITWLGISTLSQLIGLENFILCVRPTDFVEICISESPRGLPIHRIEVKYQFFVHPNINKKAHVRQKVTIDQLVFSLFLHSRQLSEFFDKILSKFQCGFRRGYGTQHRLLPMLEIWKGANDNSYW